MSEQLQICFLRHLFKHCSQRRAGDYFYIRSPDTHGQHGDDYDGRRLGSRSLGDKHIWGALKEGARLRHQTDKGKMELSLVYFCLAIEILTFCHHRLRVPLIQVRDVSISISYYPKTLFTCPHTILCSHFSLTPDLPYASTSRDFRFTGPWWVLGGSPGHPRYVLGPW